MLRKPKVGVSKEISIQKSRFLAFVQPVDSPEQARELLKELKHRYEDATHVVHAFITGRENSLTTGYSDDGEPPGTAGRPVYDVVRGTRATGIFVAVARWFGGTKLGTGGLVKAYGDSTKAVLDLVDWEEDLDWAEFFLEVEYPQYEALCRALESRGGVKTREEFTHKVALWGRILSEHRLEWETWFRDATRGTGSIFWLD